MTFATTDLPVISPYTVNTTRSELVMTSADFNYYLNLATLRATREVPSSMDTATKDLAIGYLVCHMKWQASSAGAGDYQSESIGGYSYSRKSDVPAGSSSWEQKYLALIKSWGARQPQRTNDVTTDSVLRAEFALDDNELRDTDDGVVFFDGDV
jgi:hypothetical protein